ncbi:MAG: hypothetical protein ACW9W4_10420 [Candidatus Nitrosopumilus sp. bin_7KS]
MKTRLLIIVGIIIISVGITIGVLSQVDLYDYDKYYPVFGPRSPLAEIGTGNPVLTLDNCQRYAYWLTEHQKEKITLQEDFSVRYPPWGNQIFPLVDYCTKTGQLDKTVINEMLKWEFTPVSQGMYEPPSEIKFEPTPEHSPKLISKSLAIFYAAEQRDLIEEDLKKYDSRATLLKIRNNGFAFEIDPNTLEERELHMNRFNEYHDGQYIWLVFLVKNNEYQYHINATDGKILLSAQDGAVLTEPEPAPFPSKCKSGPAPSNEYYFDEHTCDWKLK